MPPPAHTHPPRPCHRLPLWSSGTPHPNHSRCSSPIPLLPSSSASHGAPWHRGALSAAHAPQPGQGLALWLRAARGQNPVEPWRGTGGAGKAQGPWVRGTRPVAGAGAAQGWGVQQLPCPANPCQPLHTHTCARTHTHTRARTHTTHMHTTPPGQSQPGGTGYIQHSPPVGTSRSGQDQRHSNPEPEQPHLSREAGADRGRRGRDWGQAGERQGGHRLRLQGPSSGLYWELEGVMLME